MKGTATWHPTSPKWEECAYNPEKLKQGKAKRERTSKAKKTNKAQKTTGNHTENASTEDTPQPDMAQPSYDWFDQFVANSPDTEGGKQSTSLLDMKEELDQARRDIATLHKKTQKLQEANVELSTNNKRLESELNTKFSQHTSMMKHLADRMMKLEGKQRR